MQEKIITEKSNEALIVVLEGFGGLGPLEVINCQWVIVYWKVTLENLREPNQGLSEPYQGLRKLYRGLSELYGGLREPYWHKIELSNRYKINIDTKLRSFKRALQIGNASFRCHEITFLKQMS